MTSLQLTHYEILEVSENASLNEIKHQFQKLILYHHPDKSHIPENPFIHQLLAAYTTLRDPQSRALYDSSLHSKHLSLLSITAEIDLDDMEHEEDKFWAPCRCGGRYVINEKELDSGIDIVQCGWCSLRVRILYEVLEGDDDNMQS